jgi:general secretion pathway protein M
MRAFFTNRDAVGALGVFLIVLASLIGGLFIAANVLDAKQVELTARQTELEALNRRPLTPATSSRDAAIVDPFLGGNSFALAANALQQRVVGLVEEAGGTLITVGVDPPATGDDMASRRVAVQIVAQMGNDALQKLLYRLETEAPVVFVDSLVVTRPTDRGGEAAESKMPVRLTVDLRVIGYLRRSTS